MPQTSHTIKPNWSIALASDDPVACFAAAELRRTLQRIGAPPLPFVERAEGVCIALSHGDQGDGFTRDSHTQGVRLRGEGPRGLLYAVYELLEALGCRWVAPGHDGERLPRYEQVVLPSNSVVQQPTLPDRCLIIGHDFFLHEAEEWIVWAARNRLNTLFIHTIDEPLALGACHLAGWRDRRAKLLPLLRERGMMLELGGHGMRALVPRTLFRSVPQAFRHNGTRRTPDHNFCPTSPEAQALLRTNGAAFFRAYPEAAILHLWPDDVLGGGWCHCERCATFSPSDQALLATNILADTLATINPDAQIAYLAYHDTTTAPTQVRPHAHVVLAFAPRSRSYGHSINDPSSAVNVAYMHDLKANLAWFGGVDEGQETGDRRLETETDEGGMTNDEGQALLRPPSTVSRPRSSSSSRIFEYYLDGLLFKSTPPPLQGVLPEDLAAYAAAGAHTVQVLMTGDRPWLATPINAYLFARLAWDPSQPVSDLLATYATARAPHARDALVRIYEMLATAWQPALAIVPGEVTQHVGRNLLGAPPTDVLDYMAAPRPLRERRLELIDRGLKRLVDVRQAWDDVLATVSMTDSVHAERLECELSMLQLAFVSRRQRLYVLEGRLASAPVLQAASESAQTVLDAIFAWGEEHLESSRAQVNFALLHQMTQLQLDAVRNRRLLGPLGRTQLQANVYRRVGVLLARVRRYRS